LQLCSDCKFNEPSVYSGPSKYDDVNVLLMIYDLFPEHFSLDVYSSSELDTNHKQIECYDKNSTKFFGFLNGTGFAAFDLTKGELVCKVILWCDSGPKLIIHVWEECTAANSINYMFCI
jgi:hypothetical protein